MDSHGYQIFICLLKIIIVVTLLSIVLFFCAKFHLPSYSALFIAAIDPKNERRYFRAKLLILHLIKLSHQ
jgi:hypothetical protein